MSSSQAVSENIRQRRTIKPKQFSDRPIDKAVISELLENANWAPTHGMTEPWRFSIYTGDARRRLAEFLAATYKELTPPENFKPNKYEGMSKNAMLAQAVLVIGMKRQEIEKISELDELMAVACAVQNIHLSATAHGLGAFWSTNVAAVSDKMRDFIGLGPKDRALGLFYLGYPDCDWPNCTRGSIEDKVRWIEE
ncbi:MAG: nitroreductase [Rubripirellula sp.]